MNPDINNLKIVTEKFDAWSIPYTLGGSGLMLSLGLINTINDWDVMVEASKDRVMHALQNEEVEELTCGDYPFGTDYKLVVHTQRPQVEILGGFSIYTAKGLCRIPSITGSIWNGIHVSSPEVWYVAYALMNRKAKADVLLNYLKEVGANQDMLNLMMNEPLPDEIIEEIGSLRVNANK